MAIFTLNFHCYESRFQQLGYILIAVIYKIFLLYDVTSRDDCDPQNIADPRKDCGYRYFVDEKMRALHRRNLNKYTVKAVALTV